MSQFSKPGIRSKDLERVIREHINKGFKEYLRAYKTIPETGSGSLIFNSV
jgi:hypothetical protein